MTHLYMLSYRDLNLISTCLSKYTCLAPPVVQLRPQRSSVTQPEGVILCVFFFQNIKKHLLHILMIIYDHLGSTKVRVELCDSV